MHMPSVDAVKKAVASATKPATVEDDSDGFDDADTGSKAGTEHTQSSAKSAKGKKSQVIDLIDICWGGVFAARWHLDPFQK